MNLIIDGGNTYVKFAVFQMDDLLYKTRVINNDFQLAFEKIIVKYNKINRCIISSVGQLDNKSITLLKEEMDVLLLDSTTKLPFNNLYKTPKTLGVDRIALVSAAVYQFPEKNVLIIDAGTCITYDFLTKDANYLGGAISPGIRMRYQSLNNLTANLPLLETKPPDSIIGNSTNEAIHSGIIYGVLKEIDGIIYEYQQKYADLTIILTGGDANFLSKQLKSSIFANSNFLLEGLNHILQYNSNE